MTPQQTPESLPRSPAVDVTDSPSVAADHPETNESYLERSLPWWHGTFALVTGVLLLIVLGGGLEASRRVFAVTLLLAVAFTYLTLARRVLLRARPNAPLAVAYLMVLCPTTVVMVGLVPNGGTLLLFVMFPHVWALLSTRWAVVTSSLVVVAMVAITLATFDTEELTGADVIAALTSGIFTLALALLMGLWLSWMIDDNERYRTLVAELRGTRAELAEAHHREGVLAERQRLAAEIHDTLAQGFMSILVLSQAPPTADQLPRIERVARENLSEARSLVEALGPDELREGNLADACQRVVQRLDAEPTGPRATFELVGEPRGRSVNVEVVLLRATQEALTNVSRHADAGLARVRLRYGTTTKLEVTDDGRGFEPTAPTSGFGLRGMRHRVEQVGGHVQVASEPRRGTVVRVEVP